MKNVRFDRTATAWASAALMLGALTLAPARGVAADPGAEAPQAVPLLQMVERLWEGLAHPFELLYDTVTAASDSGPIEATSSSDDSDLETSIMHGPKIDPNG